VDLIGSGSGSGRIVVGEDRKTDGKHVEKRCNE
jgi:hypothetical protein